MAVEVRHVALWAGLRKGGGEEERGEREGEVKEGQKDQIME